MGDAVDSHGLLQPEQFRRPDGGQIRLRFKKKGDRRSIHGRSPLFSPRALHRGETLTYVACLNASTSRWRNCTDVLSDPDVELGHAMSRIGARTELGVPLLRERIAAGGVSMLVPSGIHAGR